MRFLKTILQTGVFFLAACSNNNEAGEQKPAAIAGEEKLSVDDLRAGLISGGNVKDSAYVTKQFIERWATENLFYQEAQEKLTAEELDVEEQVEAYRRSLVNYIYETKLVEANLDTVVTREEIEKYYNEHPGNFILRENIVKVNYVKIPVKAKDLEKIKRLLYLNNPKDEATLKNLCVQNAESFFMNDSTWLLLDDIKKEIPKLRDEPDVNLNNGRIVEFSDEAYYYYLKVKDVKVKNGVSPINFESRSIHDFIVNNRRMQLIQQYKREMLEKAQAEKRFVVY